MIKLLKEKKIIKDKEQMVDATVYPSNIRYPTDTGLIEKVREWVVRKIKEIEKTVGIKEKVRTYCRKAKKTYLRFQKKRKKTGKEIGRVKKQMLQYVRRNIGQLKELIERIKELPVEVVNKIREQLKVAEDIFKQQMEMLREKKRSVKDRIVSFHRPEIRPIVRGKSGKEVEFGPKVSVSYVDGYLFLDKISFDAYHEGKLLKEDIEKHKERFGKNPKVIITDKIYGSLDNRKMLKAEGIKGSLIPLGRKSKESKFKEDWVLRKQKKRNRIEGAIGNSKVNYGLERILSRIVGSEEIYIRMGLIAMNLTTMMRRA